MFNLKPGLLPTTALAPVLVAALAGLACGTAATPTPTGKAAPTAPGTPAVVTAAPAPTATPKPKSIPRVGERTLKVGLQSLNFPPDPALGGFLAVQSGIGETLFKLGRDMKPEPWLATGARRLDEKTWEVTLRQGVKFHNGALMDAVAVEASLERAIAKSTRAKTLLDIARIEVQDTSTVIITTNKPSPILPALLTELTAAVVNAAAAEAMGDAFKEGPVLTGPFKVERFQQDKELLVVGHTEYWGPPPLLDRVIFTALPDPNSRLLALQSGDIDIAIRIDPNSVPTVKGSPTLTVRSGPPIYLEFLYLNHRRDPWKDLRVRQAIAVAIDREALSKGVTQGQGAPAIGPFPPAVLGCYQLRGHPFDPAKARQLLAQAGYQDKDGDGFVEKEGETLAMTLLTYRFQPELSPMAEVIQASLKAIGIKVNVRTVENPNPVLQQGDWDGGMYYVTMGVTGDAYLNLSQYFITGGSANFGGYSSSRVDELTSQLGIASDRQTREQLACAASQAIIDELPVVPLIYPSFDFGVSRKVVGFDQPHPFAWYFIDSQIGKR